MRNFKELFLKWQVNSHHNQYCNFKKGVKEQVLQNNTIRRVVQRGIISNYGWEKLNPKTKALSIENI